MSHYILPRLEPRHDEKGTAYRDNVFQGGDHEVGSLEGAYQTCANLVTRIRAGDAARHAEGGAPDYARQLLLSCCKLDPANTSYRQTLRQLPRTRATVFTIRTYVTSAAALAENDEEFVPALLQSLDSAPASVQRYKGWTDVATRLRDAL